MTATETEHTCWLTSASASKVRRSPSLGVSPRRCPTWAGASEAEIKVWTPGNARGTRGGGRRAALSSIRASSLGEGGGFARP